MPDSKWGPDKEEHRQLSVRYANQINSKHLSIQTLSTIDIDDRFNMNSTVTKTLITNPKLLIKRVSNAVVTRF